MDSLFPIKVWGLTALFGALMVSIGVFIFDKESQTLVSFLTAVLNIWVYGLGFCLPAFGLHFFSFKFLSKRLESVQTLKLSSCVIGASVLLLFSFFFGFFSQPLDLFSLVPVAYVLGLIISTVIVKINLVRKTEETLGS